VTTAEERLRRKEQRRERAGILPPPSNGSVVRSFFVLLLMGEALLWFVRLVRPGRTHAIGPDLRDTWLVAAGCLVYLVAMLVLRYRRIRADELRNTNAGADAHLQTDGMDYDNDGGKSGS
jgi:hypothetical protein